MLAAPAARTPGQNSGQGLLKGVISLDILSRVGDVHLNNWQTCGGTRMFGHHQLAFGMGIRPT